MDDPIEPKVANRLSQEPSSTKIQESAALKDTISSTADGQSGGELDGGVGGYESNDEAEEEPAPSKAEGLATEVADADVKISKNRLKKLKRKQNWEAQRDDRRRFKKEKRNHQQARKREEKAAKIAEAEAAGIDPETLFPKPPVRPKGTLVPVSLIVDCDFEKYMTDTEQISMSSQLVRCYSDNKNARYQVHIYISSFGGSLKERWETMLQNQYLRWKGVHLVQGDFVAAAKEAEERMNGPEGGTLIDILKPDAESSPAMRKEETRLTAVADPEFEPSEELKSVIYLSSESPYTLQRLEPNTCYVIGGIVDRNREKGLCYKRAQERGIRTAKLPIGEYMEMQSRQVLTTNQVVDIMLKWLDFGDWGRAFLAVMPKRKGGRLKGTASVASSSNLGAEDSRLDEEDDEDMDERQTITENVGPTQAEGVEAGDGKDAELKDLPVGP